LPVFLDATFFIVVLWIVGASLPVHLPLEETDGPGIRSEFSRDAPPDEGSPRVGRWQWWRGPGPIQPYHGPRRVSVCDTVLPPARVGRNSAVLFDRSPGHEDCWPGAQSAGHI